MSTSVLDMIDGADVCSLSFLVGLLLLAGHWLVGKDGTARKRGASIGSFVFIVYLMYGVMEDGFSDVAQLISRILRAGLAAGICVSVSWMILPYLTVVERQRQRTKREHELEIERKRIKAEADRKEAARVAAERLRQQEAIRSAPARQQQQLTEAEKAERETANRAAEQQQREAARFECQLLYDRHAELLTKSFPRDRFDSHVQQWLGDDRKSHDVNHHASKLRQLIKDLVAQASAPRAKFQSLRDIAEYFSARRDEVQSLSYDSDTKSTLIASINIQENIAMTEFFKT